MLANGIREDYYTPYGGFTEAENGLGLAGFIIGIVLVILPVLCPIVFMSNKAAHEFEGWDLMVSIGLDPRDYPSLGFYAEDEKAGGVDYTAESKETQMTNLDEKREPD